MSDTVCTACMFCRSKDVGYSNYTVMGTVHDCVLNLNGEVDTETASDDAVSKWASVAEKCFAYREGTGLYEDCDGEETEANIKEWMRIHLKDGAQP